MRHLLLSAAALMVLPGSALAQQAAPQSISKTAFMTTMQSEFTQIDTNKDGAVSTAELDAARSKALADAIQRRSAAAFAQLDADKNGSLSQAEFARAMKPSGKLPASPLVAMDSNKDGKISAAEYKAAVEGIDLTKFAPPKSGAMGASVHY